MQSKQRYVVVSVLALAILISMILSRGYAWIWMQFGWEDQLMFSLRELTLTTLLGYLSGFGLAAFVLKHQPTHQLAYEVVDELSKVSWPSREETGNATMVVIVTVLVCAIYLGVFDAVWLWLTDTILGIPRGTTG